MTDDSYIAFLPESVLRRRLSDPNEVDELVAHVLRTQDQLRALVRCAREYGVPAAAITEAVFSADNGGA